MNYHTFFARAGIAIQTAILIFLSGCSTPDNINLAVQKSSAQNEVGSLNARFSVSPSGSALHRIEIQVPPGIKNVQPDLTFSYNSSSQNGLMGVGWNLTGFGKISRVKSIFAIEGESGQINFNNQDKFAINGKRLLLMAGQNGQQGAEYRQEIDSWWKVSVTASNSAGPLTFTAQTPKGTILEFGGTGDSRVLTSDKSAVREWLISKSTDQNGNEISYRYSSDPNNSGKQSSMAYPTEIAYGANSLSQPATPANRFVKFEYETRTDVIRHLLAGTSMRNPLRLMAVNTYLQSQLVSNYRISYTQSDATGRSLVRSIQRFASQNSNAVGLSPNLFSYQSGGNKFAGAQSWLSGYFTKNSGWDSKNNPVELADVNGDGLVDIIGFKNGVQVALANKAGFDVPSTWANDFSPRYNWTADQPRYLTDINGDGLADIIGFSNNGVVVALANPQSKSFVKSPTIFPYFSPNTGWTKGAPRYLADVNGDKAADIIGFSNNVSVALADLKGGFKPPQQWISGFGLAQGWTADDLLVADANGDGKSDVVAMNQQTRSINVALSTGHGFSQSGWNQSYNHFADSTTWTNDNPRMMADVNGDGLADVVGFGTTVQVGLSNGTGFEPPEQWSSNFGAPNWDATTPRMMTDVNGDGLSDVIGIASGRVEVALSTSQQFVPANWNQSSLNGLSLAQAGSATDTSRSIVDINGDGLLDVIGFSASSVLVGLAADSKPDLLTGITRSSLGKIDIEYKPIADPSVYQETPGVGALAKAQSYRPLVQNPSFPAYRSSSKLTGRYYVVSKVSKTNNQAITSKPFNYVTTHRYQNASVSNTGRGWLGFSSSSHTNLSAGRQTEVEYSQTFPTIGKPLKRTVSCSSSQTGNCAQGDLFHVDNMSYLISSTIKSPITGYQSQLVRLSKLRSDRYQGTNYQHSIGTNFSFDKYGNKVQTQKLNLVDKSGNDINSADNVYLSTSYLNDETNWRLGYELYKKKSSSSSIASISSFSPSTDFWLRQRSYDSRMNIRSKLRWDDALKQFVGNTLDRDVYGNLVKSTKSSGAFTTYAIDKQFNTYRQVVSRAINAQGDALTSHLAYDARFGLKAVKVDANGNAFTTCYDDFGRRQSRQGPAPASISKVSTSPACVSSNVTLTAGLTIPNLVTKTTYQHRWNQGVPERVESKITDWQNQSAPMVNVYRYDGLERRYKMLSSSAEANTGERIMEDKTFDSNHNALVSALPYFDGSASIEYQTMDYDALGRQIQAASPWLSPQGMSTVSDHTEYITTADGEKIVRSAAPNTSAASQLTTTKQYFDNQLGIVSTLYQEPTSQTSVSLNTTLGRDPIGRITQISPPGATSQAKVSYAYDSLGRLSAKTLPALGNYQFAYDMDGWLIGRKQNNGQVTISRDWLGRALQKNYPGSLTIDYVYDAKVANGLGRLASASVKGQTIDVTRRYQYNEYGWLEKNTLDLSNNLGSFSSTTVYDPLARVRSRTQPNQDQLSFDYSADQMISQSLNGKEKLSLSKFTAAGLPSAIDYANGVSTQLTYAPDFNISAVSTSINQQNIFDEQYQRDPYGNPTKVVGKSQQWPSYTKTATFSARRLVNNSDSRLSPNSNILAYDDVGNLINAPSLSIKTNGYLMSSGSTFQGSDLNPSYDSMGGLLSLNAQKLKFSAGYDGRNRTNTMVQNDGKTVSQFAYDHLGFRVWKGDTSNKQSQVFHSYQFDQQIGNQITDRLTLYTGLGPSFFSSGGREQYLHTDARSSVIAASANNGSVNEWFTYSASGEPVNASRNASVPYGFMGRLYDNETGVYYLHSRYYHPQIARFTSADTQYASGIYRHDSPNRYAFLLNNPTTGYDPTGHGLPSCIAATGGGLFALASGISQIIDGENNNNQLSAIGVGGGATVAGTFAVGAGFLACRKYLRNRAQRGGGDDNADDSDSSESYSSHDSGYSRGDDSEDEDDYDDFSDDDRDPPSASNSGTDSRSSSEDSEEYTSDGSDAEQSSSGSEDSAADDSDDSEGDSDSGSGDGSDDEFSSAADDEMVADEGGAEMGGSSIEMDTLSVGGGESASAASSTSSALTSSLGGEAGGLEASTAALSTGSAVGEGAAGAAAAEVTADAAVVTTAEVAEVGGTATASFFGMDLLVGLLAIFAL